MTQAGVVWAASVRRMLAAAVLATWCAAFAAPAAADTTGSDTGTGYEICPTVYYYVVPEGSPGLESIADLVLGDPERADEIYEYNAGRTQADGGALGEDREVRPGWRLVVPFDAGGEGVYEGPDPLCVVAVEEANALGVAPPSPPPPPPAYTPPPEEPTAEASPSSTEEEPSIDPRVLAAGAAGLVVLTLVTLFWQPIGRAVTWPFRRIAAARANRPKKRRTARPGVAARRRREATDLIDSDPDAAKRAGTAHAELISAPSDVPARPVALLTTRSETTAVVPAGATPPASSWRVVDTTTWRYGSGRSSAPVNFGTSVHTMVGTALRGVLVCLGRKEDTDALVHVDFTRMRGLLAVDGDPKVASDTVRVVADGLHAAGLSVRVLKQGRPLHSLVPDTTPVVAAPDPIHGLDPGSETPTVVVVPRPLGQADEHVLTSLPPGMIVVAMGASHSARWQWEAFDDGTVDTGALGIDVVVRMPGRRG
ncbi:hypothetical protein [Nocardiopsis halotolerans]|uniref:hypothetical protein n=1 Tax=Nocardiopsis halotolerans TaxID=124252 RepID=UPI0004765B3D|nr:hypothetical protein [Nocardiopsis halotolerans]